MLIGLTGTPGTGKTTVASLLQDKYTVISINDVAFTQGFVVGKDEQRDTQLIDVDAINEYLKKTYSSSEESVFVEGHCAHLLDCVEKIIILRCHPKQLQKRLQTKNWSDAKIKENAEAEALDVILCETTEHFEPQDIFEIDTTQKTPKQVYEVIQNIVKSRFASINTYTIGQIDWSEEFFTTS